jgi:1-aminocyclopropane-1-carboxylate deaminase
MQSIPSQFNILLDDYEQRLQSMAPLQRLGLHDPVRLHNLPHPVFEQRGLSVTIARADQIHPVISGNKWFKLKYNVVHACQLGCTELLSFGGAWSNHLHALAYLANCLNLSCTGIVRGEEHSVDSNIMLQEAAEQGMRLRFVSRQTFRELRQNQKCEADTDSPHCYTIAEGGDNWLGVLGAASMLRPVAGIQKFNHVITSVGTGCTFAGLRLGLPSGVNLVGVSALKGSWVAKQMQQRFSLMNLAGAENWRIDTNHHRGGFAAVDEALLSFIAGFRDNSGIELEPVYTGKTMMALFDMVEQGLFESGSRILFIHSGGLQGKRGFSGS